MLSVNEGLGFAVGWKIRQITFLNGKGNNSIDAQRTIFGEVEDTDPF